MKVLKSAQSYLEEGFSCSQSVFSACAEEYGFSREQALKISSAFGGGIAGMAETCGVVTGALMALGLRHGVIDLEDEDGKEKARQAFQNFIAQFKERHGSITCKELLGVNISIPKVKEKAIENNLFQTICTKYIKDAVELVENAD